MTGWSSVALEVEFTAGVWEDVTAYLAFEASPVTIRQGRPTELDDPGPAVLTFALRNDTGEWMPDNVLSPRYGLWRKGIRVRWKVVKSAVTYTRFTGWVTVIAPDFPGSSTNSAVVSVTAIDALGKLQQRVMRSNFTEVNLWRARTDGGGIDIYEASGTTTGQIALMSNYSPDPGAGNPQTDYAASDPALTFRSDNDLSCGGVVDASGTQTGKTIVEIQANALQIKVHIKGPDRLVDGATSRYFCTSLMDTAASSHAHLVVQQNAGNNGLYLRNGADTTNLGLLGNMPLGSWCEVVTYARTDNPARSDWWLIYSDGSATSLLDTAVDIRQVGYLWFPGQITPSLACSWGGVAALGTRTPINPEEALVGAVNGTVSTRLTMLRQACDQLPITLVKAGTLTTPALTGAWSGRTALDVAQEMVRTASGMVWARPWDGAVCAVGRNLLYPASPVATIDTDGDCVGSPRLLDGAEAKPTRIDVQWPAATATLTDTVAEADGESRTRRITTVSSTSADAASVGVDLFSRIASGGTRVSQVEVDLTSGAVDHTAALFSQTGTLGGLYPSQRVRLGVPASHFGQSTVDAYVRGWTETYSPNGSTVRIDTDPVPSSTLLTGITITNGSATITSMAPIWSSGDVGKEVSGEGIPDGTTIVSVDSPTQITVSQPATETITATEPTNGAWLNVAQRLLARDSWTGADGAAWAGGWTAGYSAGSATTDIQGMQGRLLTTGAPLNQGIARRIVYYFGGDYEAVWSWTMGQALPGCGIAFVFRSTTDLRQNCYFLACSGGAITLGRSTSFTPTTLDSQGPGAAGVKYRTRVSAVGSTLRSRTWRADQLEPDVWTLQATDATYSAGYVGFHAYNEASGVTRSFLVDDFFLLRR